MSISEQGCNATVVREISRLASLLDGQPQSTELDGNNLCLADLVFISRYVYSKMFLALS